MGQAANSMLLGCVVLAPHFTLLQLTSLYRNSLGTGVPDVCPLSISHGQQLLAGQGSLKLLDNLQLFYERHVQTDP